MRQFEFLYLFATSVVREAYDNIFAAYFHPDKRFYWLVAEDDESKEYVAGYLLGHEFEGWGTIHLDGIRRHAAIQILPWKPCSFLEAVNRVRQHLTEHPK